MQAPELRQRAAWRAPTAARVSRARVRPAGAVGGHHWTVSPPMYPSFHHLAEPGEQRLAQIRPLERIGHVGLQVPEPVAGVVARSLEAHTHEPLLLREHGEAI